MDIYASSITYCVLSWICLMRMGAQAGGHHPGASSEPVNYPMIPTDSDWDNFQCFSDDEISAIRDEYTITEDQVSAQSNFHYKSDDWSLQSFVSSILFREVMGINVDLFDFHEGASSIITDETEAVVFHWEMPKSDVGFSLDMDESEAEFALQTRWMMRSDVVSEIESELGSDSTNNLYLDILRTFKHPTVIQAMHSSNEVSVTPDDDGHFACTHQHGCYFGDSTWYPPQCNFTTNAHLNCMVLIQFLPEYDLEMNRAMIESETLPIVIKYIGSERTLIGQQNFQRLYDERWRVIFQLRSIEAQSAVDWSMIALLAGSDLVADQVLLHVWSGSLLDLSLYQWLVKRNFFLQESQVNQIQQSISDSNETITKDLRMQKACDWLRFPMNQQYGWGFWFKFLPPGMALPECDYVIDESLEWLHSKSAEEMVSGVLADSSYFSSVIGVRDAYNAIYLKNLCISKAEDEDIDGLLITAYVVSGLTLLLLGYGIGGILKWIKEPIISESSVPLLVLIHLGGIIALSTVVVLKHDDLEHCVMRKYLFQIGLTLPFGAMMAKTWRLHKILEKMDLLETVEITNRDLIWRTVALVIFVTAYLSALVLAHDPMEVTEKIEDGLVSTSCVWDETAESQYRALIGAEILALFITGRAAWSIKARNPIYNEMRFIAAIMLSNAFVLCGYLALSLFEETATMIVVESYLVTFMVALIVSILMLPKFYVIHSDQKYEADRFESDGFTFSSSVLTKDDVRRMRRLCREHGYHIGAADKLKLERDDLSITKGSSTKQIGSQRKSSRRGSAIKNAAS